MTIISNCHRRIIILRLHYLGSAKIQVSFSDNVTPGITSIQMGLPLGDLKVKFCKSPDKIKNMV
jgi:hypothetical protein